MTNFIYNWDFRFCFIAGEKYAVGALITLNPQTNVK